MPLIFSDRKLVIILFNDHKVFIFNSKTYLQKNIRNAFIQHCGYPFYLVSIA